MKKTICLSLFTIACSFATMDASAQSPAEQQKLEIKQILKERGITLNQYLEEKGLTELPKASNHKVLRVELPARAVTAKELQNEFPNDPVIKSIIPNNGNFVKNTERSQAFKVKSLPALKNTRVSHASEKKQLKKTVK